MLYGTQETSGGAKKKETSCDLAVVPSFLKVVCTWIKTFYNFLFYQLKFFLNYLMFPKYIDNFLILTRPVFLKSK